MGAFLTDGTKAVPLSALRPEAWQTWSGEPDEDPDRLSAVHAYRVVPWLYRAIDVRAKAVAAVPYALYRNGEDITKDEALRPLHVKLRTMFRQAEATQCLYGATYYELGTNRFGRNLTPFWLLPGTVHPDIDTLDGLKGFRRLGPNGVTELTLEQVIYIWQQNLLSELGPGLAPAAVVLTSAGLLHYLDVFASGFFKRGGVKMTLLSVPDGAKPAEVEKLDRWWRRMVTGVRNAFGSVVVRTSVEPKVIGSNINETSAPALTKMSREDVATGMGVPHSLLASNVLAGGTADAERLNFYDFTIVPECQLIEEAFNEQWLDRVGLRIEFQPERLEVYQKGELSKAQALAQLVGQPVMLVDEARERLELKPMAEVAPAEPPPPSGAAADAALADPAAAGLEAAPAESLLLPGPIDPSALKLAAITDLVKWERKALNRLKAGKSAGCDFESDEIPVELAEGIEGALQDAGDAEAVKHLFGHMKAGGKLSLEEQRLAEAIAMALAKMEPEVVAAIQSGEAANLDALGAKLQGAIVPALSEYLLDQAQELAFAIGPDVDPAFMQSQATSWSATYTAGLIRGLTDRTRAVVEQAVSTYRDTPGMTREQLLRLLRPAFGAVRAEMIAITELTRAAAQASVFYQEELGKLGVDMERVWRTANDERVCPVCGPRNGRVVEELPPAHPRCRCGVTLRRKKE